MAPRTLFKETYYHIYNRGFNKQQLFFEDRDFERFLKNVPRYQEKFPNVKILSWCVLPNHFHLIIKEVQPGFGEAGLVIPESANISAFMNRLQQAYAVFFNTKYGEKIKQGLKSPVFEGRFQSREIMDEDYLAHLQAYVELNAVKHELVENPEEWDYSSFNSDSDYNIGKDDFDPYFE